MVCINKQYSEDQYRHMAKLGYLGMQMVRDILLMALRMESDARHRWPVLISNNLQSVTFYFTGPYVAFTAVGNAVTLSKSVTGMLSGKLIKLYTSYNGRYSRVYDLVCACSIMLTVLECRSDSVTPERKP